MTAGVERPVSGTLEQAEPSDGARCPDLHSGAESLAEFIDSIVIDSFEEGAAARVTFVVPAWAILEVLILALVMMVAWPLSLGVFTRLATWNSNEAATEAHTSN